jgi:hypothetical protein
MVSPVEKNDAAFVCERSPLLVTAFFLGYLQPIRTSISKMGNDVYYSPKPHPGFQNQRRSCRHPYPQSYSAWLPSTPANRRPWLGGGCSAEPRLDNSCSVRARRCERWEDGDAFPRGLLGTPVQMRWGATAAASQFRYPHPDLAGETFINDRYGRGWRSVFPH